MSVTTFGTHKGHTVRRAEIRSDAGLTASAIEWGGILQDLVLDVGGKPRRLVLGFETMEAYIAGGAHIGATAGRCANRIRNARFMLEEKRSASTRTFPVATTYTAAATGSASGLGRSRTRPARQ